MGRERGIIGKNKDDLVVFVVKEGDELITKIGKVEFVLSSDEARRAKICQFKSGRTGKWLVIRCQQTGQLYQKRKSVCKEFTGKKESSGQVQVSEA